MDTHKKVHPSLAKSPMPIHDMLAKYAEARRIKQNAEMDMMRIKDDVEMWCRHNPVDAIDQGFLVVTMTPKNPRK